jgi:hypothetical protein
VTGHGLPGGEEDRTRRRVLLLATTTGYQTRAFDEAAGRLGVQLALATDRCDVLDDPWRDGAIAIRFHDEDAAVAAIVAAAHERRIDGVLVVGDRPTTIAARVGEALGLEGHPAEAARRAASKAETRERLRHARLPVPWFATVPVDRDPIALAPGLRYPLVVKPVSLSGSRGVIRADDAAEFAVAFNRLRALLRSPDIRAERNPAHDLVVIEGFVSGREYALEGILERGRLRVLALFDKPDPLDGPFFEETIYVTPSRAAEPVQESIHRHVERAAAAIGLWHGPIHAECRVNDAGVFVLEVAARPIGGLCARALRFEDTASSSPMLPRSFEELLIRHALGEPLEGWTREKPASGVMMIPIPRRGVLRRMDGVEDARLVQGVVDVRITAKPDQVLTPLPEGASYLGFIFTRASEPAAAEHALREAHARLRPVIDPALTIVSANVGREQLYNHIHG